MQALASGCDAGAVQAGTHAGALLPANPHGKGQQRSAGGSDAVFKTLYAWSPAVSPHLAVQMEGG